ncbi:MAG: hypothetical protein QG652_1687 [Pseudomonadota bacterium]|nr:hypothetical protein [Pseudomonadota bacterium]
MGKHTIQEQLRITQDCNLDYSLLSPAIPSCAGVAQAWQNMPGRNPAQRQSILGQSAKNVEIMLVVESLKK